MIKDKINEKGQALLFVVVTMAVALAIGVGVSLRTLSSISRTTTSDTSSRVLAAAEGGAERFLSMSYTELSNAASGTCPAHAPAFGDGTCAVTFSPITGDNITAKAYVKVEDFGAVPAGSYLSTSVKQEDVAEMNLEGYGGSSIDVCWKTQSGSGSDVFLLAYNQNGATAQHFITSGIPVAESQYWQQGFVNSTPRNGFSACYLVSLPSSPYGLRIQPLNEDVTIGVFPVGASLPVQGFRITSTGKLAGVTSEATAEKSVTVFKSFPRMPQMFSFGIYSQNGAVD